MIRCASIGSVNCYVYTTSNNAHNSFDVIVSFAIMQWQEFLKSNKIVAFQIARCQDVILF